MKKNVLPGVLESLFANNKFKINFEFLTDNVDVKSIKNVMPNLEIALMQILNDNIDIIKNAYYKDLNFKFPAKLVVDIKNVEISILTNKKNPDLITSVFLNKVFKESIAKANSLVGGAPTSTKIMPEVYRSLKTYFEYNNWKFHNDTSTWHIDVKTPEKMHILYSQIIHVLGGNVYDINKHLKNWQDFFNE